MLKRELVRSIVISNTCVKLYRNWIINEVARACEHTNERTYVLTYIRTGQTLYPLHNFVVRGDNESYLVLVARQILLLTINNMYLYKTCINILFSIQCSWTDYPLAQQSCGGDIGSVPYVCMWVRTYVRSFVCSPALATSLIIQFRYNFTQVLDMTIPRTSLRFSMIGSRSRSQWLFLEKLCHHSSAFIS